MKKDKSILADYKSYVLKDIRQSFFKMLDFLKLPDELWKVFLKFLKEYEK